MSALKTLDSLPLEQQVLWLKQDLINIANEINRICTYNYLKGLFAGNITGIFIGSVVGITFYRLFRNKENRK